MEGERELEERILGIKRVAKGTTGGRRVRLFVGAVVGDRDGHVGIGFGKGMELAVAIGKAQKKAKKEIIEVKRYKNTLPHRVVGKCGGVRIFIRPASPGTGIIACDTVREILELAGVKDALSKSLGRNNWVNIAKATILALSTLRSREEVFRMRGVKE